MDAQFNFANCLVDGRGVDRDISQAAHYFKLAADNGCHTSQYNYAHMCAIGHGVDVNLAERYSKSVMTLQWSIFLDPLVCSQLSSQNCLLCIILCLKRSN